MEIVFFGAYDADRHPRVQVLIEGLRRRGHRVREVNVPLRFATRERVELLERPALVVPLLAQLAVVWVRLWWRSRRIGTVDAVVVGHLAHFDVHLARRLWPDTPIAIDFLISGEGTARDRRAGSPWMRALLRRFDHAAIRAADLVIVDTPANRGRLPPDAAASVVVPVGATREWFDLDVDGDRPTGAPALSVVFFGLYTPLQGTPAIGRALGALEGADIAVTMVGDGQERAATEAAAAGNDAVTWIDWVPAPDLPALVAGHDVCLGIFGTGDKAGRVVPTKVYQGAAAGCAIVTGDTAPQREALGDAARYVPCDDAPALAAALRELAADPERLAALRRAARARAEERFRPEAAVADLEDELDRLVAHPAGRSLR